MEENTHIVISMHMANKTPLVSEPMPEKKARGIAAVLNAIPDTFDRIDTAKVARIGSLNKHSDKAVTAMGEMFDVTLLK